MCEETADLFEDYDRELNMVLEDLLSINKKNTTSKSPEESSEKSSSIAQHQPDQDVSSRVNSQKVDSSETDQESASDNIEAEKLTQNNSPPWMKKLFKKIALETHPDKLSLRKDLSEIQKNERESFYKRAVSASENCDEMEILEIAILLEIDPGISEEKQFKIISQEIERLMKKVESYRSLVAWTWGETIGDVEIRSKLLKYIMGILKMPTLDDNIIKDYLVEFESGNDMAVFLESHAAIKRRKKIFDRKIGQKPGPSISQLRKEKSGT